MLKLGTILRSTYRIDRYLSSGGFGNTYVATNIEFDELVAIKEFFMKGVTHRDENQTTVSVSNAANRESFLEQREKFKKEARRIRKMNNPHIIKVHDLFEENGTAYYVMDYVDGDNLAERLKQTGKPMTEQEVSEILPQILDALKSVHDADIWHLDLKPANILVDRSGNVRLIDFGASKQLNAQKGGATSSTGISYTNGYAPREQMEQNYDKFGPWTDFYALGATLYTLLSNNRPPLPTDIDDDISEDKHEALPMPKSVSDDMRSCILWLMNTNRNRRPQNVEEILTRLKKEPTKSPQEVEKQEETLIIDKTEVNDENTIIEKKEDLKKEGLKKEDLELESITSEALSGNDVFINWLCDILVDKKVALGDKTITFDLIEKAAEQKNMHAFYLLGYCYYHGAGVSKDKEKAIRCFKKVIEQGEEGTTDFGFCHKNGKLLNAKEIKSIQWFREEAEQGYAEAQYLLGSCYYLGIGVNKDKVEAALWFKKAAEQGHAEAQFELGNCYYLGEGVTQDKKEAVRWLIKAAEQGNSQGKRLLGTCFFYGDGVTKDKEEAVRWYKKAAEQGDSEAMFLLGDCYYQGSGIAKNMVEAAYLYKQAAIHGYPQAQYLLADCYNHGDGVVRVAKDINEAFRWYKKAAEKGHADAQYELGCCYDTGRGVTQDKKEATRWFKLAAKNGNKDALSIVENVSNGNGMNIEDAHWDYDEKTLFNSSKSTSSQQGTHTYKKFDSAYANKGINNPQRGREVQSTQTTNTSRRDSESTKTKGIGFGILLLIVFFVLVGWAFYENNKYNNNFYSEPDVELIDTAAIDTIIVQLNNVEDYHVHSQLGDYKYTGIVADGIPSDNEGEARFIDGRYYKGPFKDGMLTGKNALFRYPNGDEFRGTFKDNAFYEGTYTIKEDGSYFTGTFKDGQPDKGTWYDKNDVIIE